MSTTKRQEEWFASAVGRAMDVDKAYGYQCKDTIDDYCVYLFGNWTNTIRPGDAAECLDGSNPDFFDKIRNNPNDPNLIPMRGDVIVWGAMRGNPAGHIAVVESANSSNVTVIEQDGFLQIPTRRKTHPYLINGGMVIGWLRPRQEKIINYTPGGAITTGGTDTVNDAEFARIVLDVIEDDPHYEENKKAAFDGHVGWLQVEGRKDVLNYRRWAKGIMGNNGVLNATLMRDHLKADQAKAIEHDRLNQNIEFDDQLIRGLQDELKNQNKTIEEQTKSMITLREDLSKAEVEATKFKDAAKNSDPITALSPFELIRLGLRKWLGLDDTLPTKEVTPE